MRFRYTAIPDACLLFTIIVSPAVVRAQDVTITHNGTAVQPCCAWGPVAVGWTYTPTTTFFLTGIDTRFGTPQTFSYGARTVTAEIRDGMNGAVLGSTSFTTSSDNAEWVGGVFSPVELNSGSSYFIDFLNVGVNADGGRLAPNALSQSGTEGFGSFAVAIHPSDPFVLLPDQPSDPIIRLTGNMSDVTTTPEPSSLALLGSGLIGLGGMIRRRKV